MKQIVLHFLTFDTFLRFSYIFAHFCNSLYIPALHILVSSCYCIAESTVLAPQTITNRPIPVSITVAVLQEVNTACFLNILDRISSFQHLLVGHSLNRSEKLLNIAPSIDFTNNKKYIPVFEVDLCESCAIQQDP